MTTEMLKNFLGSLIYNKQLEKLSLRNVAIDEMGWKYLCKFWPRIKPSRSWIFLNKESSKIHQRLQSVVT